MKPHIYKYLISLCIVWATYNVSAQKTTQKEEKVPEKLFSKFRVEADLVPIAAFAFGNTESYSFEAALQPTLLGKYYPIVEAGYAGSGKIALNGIQYHASGPFARLGFDFNVMKPKPGKKPVNNYFLAGIRLGFSGFTYDLKNITVSQDYWNESLVRNFPDNQSFNAWFEIVAGIRVEIVPRIYMGWTIRNKNRFGENNVGEFFSPYIPGYGKNNDSNWGVNYAIGYMF